MKRLNLTLHFVGQAANARLGLSEAGPSLTHRPKVSGLYVARSALGMHGCAAVRDLYDRGLRYGRRYRDEAGGRVIGAVP